MIGKEGRRLLQPANEANQRFLVQIIRENQATEIHCWRVVRVATKLSKGTGPLKAVSSTVIVSWALGEGGEGEGSQKSPY